MPEEAERLFGESDALFRALGEAPGSAHMQTNLALALVARGQYAAAQPLLIECVKVARALGDGHLVAVNLGNLAMAAFGLGDADRATSLLEETLTLARSVGDGFLVSQVLSYKGRAECRKGKLESAEASLLESLTIARELADPVAAIGTLEGLAELAFARHAPRQTAAIWGAAAHLRDETGDVQTPFPGATALADARLTLGADAFELAWREGHAMTLEEAVRYALDEQAGGDN